MSAKRSTTYEPASEKPFKLSRTGLDMFLECPQCFYMRWRLGIKRVDGPGFALNSAVDALLKKEFDAYREKKKPHPIMKKNKVDAIPFTHPDLTLGVRPHASSALARDRRLKYTVASSVLGSMRPT